MRKPRRINDRGIATARGGRWKPIRQVRPTRRARGRYLGGKVPFGFRRGESGDLPTWHSAAQPASTEIMSAADAPGTL